MEDRELDDDEGQDSVRNWVSRGKWRVICVQLEMRQRYVKLTHDEWVLLQRFTAKHSENLNILPKDFEHLPSKVKIIIEDWIQSRLVYKRKQS